MLYKSFWQIKYLSALRQDTLDKTWDWTRYARSKVFLWLKKSKFSHVFVGHLCNFTSDVESHERWPIHLVSLLFPCKDMFSNKCITPSRLTLRRWTSYIPNLIRKYVTKIERISRKWLDPTSDMGTISDNRSARLSNWRLLFHLLMLYYWWMVINTYWCKCYIAYDSCICIST